ncbi:CotH kinase family protein [Chitinispirillales bacterium ANBcel5]|uniref:CotH kinase family protein n=1 Tax=Cellulosispirillum alkaliphilum TaxID=3039283 RepID=UPI002A5942E0|nr:CotH kinase family protein [Chitinispirillales bacterium ANBcel5]
MFFKIGLLIIFQSFLMVSKSYGHVILNEIMSSNSFTLSDSDGDYEDWIEILNTGHTTINLAGFGLSDSYSEPFKWVFPAIELEPNQIIVLWASGKDRRNPQGQLHTNFRIARSGEEVILTEPAGERIDELKPVEIPTDWSVGRIEGDTERWFFFKQPTPGKPNTTEAYQEILESPRFSHTPGFYASDFFLELSHPDPQVSIHYTLDGSVPTTESSVYSEPIHIRDRSEEENGISMIPTNDVKVDHFQWTPPLENVAKGTVIRAKAFKPGYLSDQPVSATYFVFPEGASRYSLPVISVITEQENFFCDSIGIYVPGNSYVPGDSSVHNPTGNYTLRGREWEREGSIEYFDPSTGLALSQNVGYRIHGGYSRRFQSKSLRVYARNDYGTNTLNYPFFSESPHDHFRRLILRSGGNDQQLGMMRDAVAQLVVRDLNFVTQGYRPTVVFINGEYWGIKNIRERYDRHYLERVYGVDPENIDLLTHSHYAKEGSDEHYLQVYNFINHNNMAESDNYSKVRENIDVDNFIDYYAAQIITGNRDWPDNNIDFWRLRVPYRTNAPKGHDGRYRWMAYDLDYGYGLYTEPSTDVIYWMMHHKPEWSRRMFVNLIENENFRTDFINRNADLLNTTFKPHRVTGIIDSVSGLIEPEIEEHIRRWNQPQDLNSWFNEIETMREFARRRYHYVRQHLMRFFGLSETSQVTVSTDLDKGKVRINTLLIDEQTPGLEGAPYPWNGVYFKDNPIRLEPVNKEGFVFSHWLINGQREQAPVLSINPKADISVEAVFTTKEKIARGNESLIHFFHFNSINDQIDSVGELTTVLSDYSINTNALISYEGSGEGYMDLVEGTKENIQLDIGAGHALRVRNPSYNRALVFCIPTEGFEHINFSYAVTRTTNGPTQQSLYYSTAKGAPEWVPYKSGIEINEEYETKYFDFSSIASINDNPHFKVKLLFNDQSMGSSGNNRFDNVAVKGRRRREELLHYYNFNTLSENLDPNGRVRVVSSDFSLNGESSITYAGEGIGYMDEVEGTYVNSRRNDSSGSALRVRNPSAGRSLVFNMPTTGYDDILFSYAVRRTTNGATKQSLYYSTQKDTSSWILFESNIEISEEFTVNSFDFSSVEGVSDNPYFRLKITFDEQSMGSSGNNRFDNITLEGVSVSEPVLPDEPTGLTLYQNYPNPFSNSTTIRFFLPEPSTARLIIYDLRGRVVARLLNESLDEGTHEVVWNSRNSASGVYIYRLVYNGKSAVKKMILSR